MGTRLPFPAWFSGWSVRVCRALSPRASLCVGSRGWSGLIWWLRPFAAPIELDDLTAEFAA